MGYICWAMNKETILNVICKMIDCGIVSTAAAQAVSTIGYVDAKKVIEICKRNNLVVEGDNKALTPCVTIDELYALVENNALDLSLPKQEKVSETYDIVKLVSEYVDLVQIEGKPKYFGRCPFHKEKSPSFLINADEQYFYCFGCGLGGKVSDFIALAKEKALKKKGD